MPQGRWQRGQRDRQWLLTPLTGCRASEGNKRNPKCTQNRAHTHTQDAGRTQDTGHSTGHPLVSSPCSTTDDECAAQLLLVLVEATLRRPIYPNCPFLSPPPLCPAAAAASGHCCSSVWHHSSTSAASSPLHRQPETSQHPRHPGHRRHRRCCRHRKFSFRFRCLLLLLLPLLPLLLVVPFVTCFALVVSV